MTDTEKEKFRQIGIDLINEYRVRGGLSPINFLPINTPETSAFIRSIQLHEKTKKELESVKQEFDDFKQEVSDMGEAYINHAFTVKEKHLTGHKVTVGFEKEEDANAWFEQLLILPEMIVPKPDPLVEALAQLDFLPWKKLSGHADDFRAALDALGLEIREKNDDA